MLTDAEQKVLFNIQTDMASFRSVMAAQMAVIAEKLELIADYMAEDRAVQEYSMRGRKSMPHRHPYSPIRK